MKVNKKKQDPRKDMDRIFVHSYPRRCFSSVAELLRFLPEQEYQWYYHFTKNLRCDFTRLDFNHFKEYCDKWAFHVVLELSFNEGIMAKHGIDNLAQFIIKEYKKVFPLYQSLVPDFSDTPLYSPSTWDSAVERLKQILPYGIKAVRLPYLNVQINGIVYQLDSDFVYVQDSVEAGGQKPFAVCWPRLGKFGGAPLQNEYPDMPPYYRHDIYFPKKAFSRKDLKTVYTFKNQYEHQYSKWEEEFIPGFELFTDRHKEWEVEAPYFLNRKLPLPLILEGLRDSYILVCKRTDKVKILHRSY